MKKLASFLVDRRYWLFGVTIILAIVSCVLMSFVNINEDMTEYPSLLSVCDKAIMWQWKRKKKED